MSAAGALNWLLKKYIHLPGELERKEKKIQVVAHCPISEAAVGLGATATSAELATQLFTGMAVDSGKEPSAAKSRSFGCTASVRDELQIRRNKLTPIIQLTGTDVMPSYREGRGPSGHFVHGHRPFLSWRSPTVVAVASHSAHQNSQVAGKEYWLYHRYTQASSSDGLFPEEGYWRDFVADLGLDDETPTTSGLSLSAAVVQSVGDKVASWNHKFESLPSPSGPGDVGIFFDSSQCGPTYFIVANGNEEELVTWKKIRKLRKIFGRTSRSTSSVTADQIQKTDEKWFQDTMEQLIEAEMEPQEVTDSTPAEKNKKIHIKLPRVFFTPTALDRYSKILKNKRKKKSKHFEDLEKRDREVFKESAGSTDSSHLFNSQEVLIVIEHISAKMNEQEGQTSFQAGNINVVTRCPASAAVAFEYFTTNRMYCKSMWSMIDGSCEGRQDFPPGCGMSVRDELERIIDKQTPIINIREDKKKGLFSIPSWEWNDKENRKVFELPITEKELSKIRSKYDPEAFLFPLRESNMIVQSEQPEALVGQEQSSSTLELQNNANLQSQNKDGMIEPTEEVNKGAAADLPV
ncbi:unnamed protein product [Amoebophrya sp. A25]|nr:unnamed protein product [Amoebophrya sp. A25]|eukprot:GSA25T00027754001.1